MKRSASGDLIRALRVKKGMTQAELAGLLNVTDKAVSKWERGLSFPDILLLPRLAEILGTGVGDLIREYDEDMNGSGGCGSGLNGRGADLLMQRYEMSSDLRAPLHILLGCADLIGQYRDDPERMDRYLDAIKVSGRYLLDALHDMPDAEPSGGSADDGAEKYDFSGSRVLIVDDMAVNREILAELLGKTGALAEFAADGQESVDMVSGRPAGYYDLILMDILMPGMDGLEAARRIRGLGDREKAGVPVVAVTSKVTESERSAALDAGMDDFTEKPIHIDKLYGTVSRFLSGKDAGE